MSKVYSPYFVSIYWIGLIIATFKGFGELLIAASFILAILLKIITKRGTVKLNIKISWWWMFIAYYIFVSIIGLPMGNVGIKNLIEIIMKYVCLPIIIIVAMPRNEAKIRKMLSILKTIIFICAIYGFFESIFNFNILANYVEIDNKNWMIAMNGMSNYQPSSIFLHYNYYGCVLVIGWILSLLLPYKYRLFNNVCRIVLIEQLLLCQSRISWLAFVVITLIHIFKNNKINKRKVKSTILVLGMVIVILLLDPSFISGLDNFISARFNSLFAHGLNDGSLGQRVGTLLNWPDYFANNILAGIFGTGYQSINVNFMEVYSYFPGYSTADSTVTILLVELGLVGVGLFVCAVVETFRLPNKGSLSSLVAKYCLIVFLIESLTLDIASNNFIIMLLYITLIQKYRNEKFVKLEQKAIEFELAQNEK